MSNPLFLNYTINILNVNKSLNYFITGDIYFKYSSNNLCHITYYLEVFNQ